MSRDRGAPIQKWIASFSRDPYHGRQRWFERLDCGVRGFGGRVWDLCRFSQRCATRGGASACRYDLFAAHTVASIAAMERLGTGRGGILAGLPILFVPSSVGIALHSTPRELTDSMFAVSGVRAGPRCSCVWPSTRLRGRAPAGPAGRPRRGCRPGRHTRCPRCVQIPVGEFINIWFLYQWRLVPPHLHGSWRRRLCLMVAWSLGGWLVLALGSYYAQLAVAGPAPDARLYIAPAATLTALLLGAWLCWEPTPPARPPPLAWYLKLSRGGFTCAPRARSVARTAACASCISCSRRARRCCHCRCNHGVRQVALHRRNPRELSRGHAHDDGGALCAGH